LEIHDGVRSAECKRDPLVLWNKFHSTQCTLRWSIGCGQSQIDHVCESSKKNRTSFDLISSHRQRGCEQESLRFNSYRQCDLVDESPSLLGHHHHLCLLHLSLLSLPDLHQTELRYQSETNITQCYLHSKYRVA